MPPAPAYHARTRSRLSLGLVAGDLARWHMKGQAMKRTGTRLEQARRYVETHKKPAILDGIGCEDCHGFLCDWHKAQGQVDWERKSAALDRAAKGARSAELDRISSRFEFESDEFMTRIEKAEQFRTSGHIAARY